MAEKAIAEDFFDPAYYNVLWARRYFCPHDINHYLYEVVKDKDGNLHVDAYEILTGDLTVKKAREYEREQFIAAFKEFRFYDALTFIPRWLV